MTDTLNLKLDPDMERELLGYLDHDMALGKFRLDHNSVFVLDAHGGDPGRASFINRLKEKFSFVDFDAGGVKLLDLNIKGNPARLSLIPRWKMPPPEVKGSGGPSIALQFTMHF